MKKNTQPLKIALIFGGKSAEHEISIISAKNVINNLDKVKYQVILIYIDKIGRWYHVAEIDLLQCKSRINTINKSSATLINGDKGLTLRIDDTNTDIDVVFPVLHGPNGEDGSIQGLCHIYNVAYVGCDILGSAICMDKEVSKRLLVAAGIKTAKFLAYHNSYRNKINYQDVKKNLGLPFFVKPANLGSSVGISKVYRERDFIKAIKLAYTYDNKIIIEEYIKGREIECSVLEDEEIIISDPGEIVVNHDYYSYEAKYIDENGAQIIIPAQLSNKINQQIKNIALQAFQVLSCSMMARVDLFLTSNDEIYINEINTIPGFTSISMYPKLLRHSGINYQDIINILIKKAIKRHNNTTH